MKGYGRYIREAREATGMSPEQLGERIGRTVSTMRRIESEETEPSAEQINRLVAALPISTEVLLRKMGVELTPPAAARLPRQLVLDLLSLPADALDDVAGLVHRLARVGRSLEEPTP